MSGIAGIIGSKKKSLDKNIMNMMLDKISHRGENRKIFQRGDDILGINSHYDVDIDADMKQGENLILLDGRIYNIDMLLEKYGIQSDSCIEKDTSKIEILFKKEGKDILKEFKGPFALAIYDTGGDLYLCRDLLGKKPLYYSKYKDRLIFASEVKSLVKSCNKIKEFPPGSCMENYQRPKTLKKIDTDKYPVFEDTASENLEKRLQDYLLKAIEKRISSDHASFGVWLSGGLDSSIVVGLLKEFTDRIYTFSVGYDRSPDLESARVVAKHLGTRHKEYRLDSDKLFSELPEVIYYLESFDAPLVRSSLGNMIASKMSSTSDIVFSGEGGDELFGGYDYFLEFDSSETIQEGLVEAINSLHNTALQRVDRTANAYMVNVRLPMLDENLLDFVLKIPPAKKVIRKKATVKYILRKVASKYLPDSIAWREKDKFWEGAGIQNTLESRINDMVSDEEFHKNRKVQDDILLRNKEELYYYRIFNEHYPDINISDIISLTADFN